MRTGGYQVPALTEIEVARRYLDALEERDAARAQLAVAEPKAAYVDTYVADNDLLSIRTVAANLGIREHVIRELLVRAGWIYAETATRWSNKKGKKITVRRYSAYAHKQTYFSPVEHHDVPRFGSEVMHTLKVTPAGAEAIARLLAREARALAVIA
jgi:phage antirepressor YoqD-like protein